jgi:hypothetical protein
VKRGLGVLALVALAAAGCTRRGEATASSGGESTAELTASAPVPSASAGSDPTAVQELGPIEAGPAASGDQNATKETRERAVLNLLAGGEPATRLPVVAVDTGEDFDPSRRDRVAPEVRVGVFVRAGELTVNGRLPPEVIKRIVRQHFGKIRLCYENALRRDPRLAGNVVVRFVIDRQGAVASATTGGSTIRDAAMVECVRNVFPSLAFPSPESGTVDVSQVIRFASNE